MAGKTSETVYIFDEGPLRRWCNWEIGSHGTELDPEAAAIRNFIIRLAKNGLPDGSAIELPLLAIQALNSRDSKLF